MSILDSMWNLTLICPLEIFPLMIFLFLPESNVFLNVIFKEKVVFERVSGVLNFFKSYKEIHFPQIHLLY